jgi:C_GCAxxG_C_C family probable redox protein
LKRTEAEESVPTMAEGARELRSLVSTPPRSGSGSSTRAERAELRASTLYESGYWCAESVVKTVNEIAGEPMPAEVMRLASGFCEGFGGSRCTCGALAGSVMAIGMLSGRVGPDDDWRPSYDAAGELQQRFVADQNATTCDEIVARIGGMHLPQRWAHCAELVGRCTRWVIEIAETEHLF